MGRLLKMVIVLIVTVLSLFSQIRVVDAQSCGSGAYYYAQSRNATCPANKSCGNPCQYSDVYSTACSNISGSCYGILGYAASCSFSTCNLSTFTQTCTVNAAPYEGSTGGVQCNACPYTAWTNQGCGGSSDGVSCAGQMRQRKTPTAFSSICRAQTRCVADTTCSDPKPPTNLSGSCAATNTVSLSWDSMASATFYALRVDDQSDGHPWDGTCSGGGDFCANVGTNSYSFTGTLNHAYNWWVHSVNGTTGFWSTQTNGTSFSCLGVPPSSTPTPTSTPTPSPTQAAQPYFKVKSTSMYKLGNLSSTVPVTATAYDGTDVAPYTVFNQGNSGIVAAQGSINVGSGSVSSSGWSRATQTIPSTFNAAAFKSYVMTKKSATTITNVSQITAAGTYYYNGDLTLSSDIAQNNVVLVVNGNVTINGSGVPVKFNGTNRPFALVVSGSPAKTLTFSDALTEADGLYIADDVQFSTTESSPSTTPLKIVGNVSSAAQVSVIRARTAGTTAPSLFIVFDPTQYVGLFDKLSVVKSSWTQIQ